ncbi:ADP-ribosylglycohydrolase [Clostridium ragsdalei P11]|uniref:ADP-ribosylglycohydrolase n=1 Tax=Clostridium ragsdalei P11 TaxID=1353534 RepID=A0A1A6AWH4_9CLOT|nr:ADP-ribosylglycohydrolase family protein [Clostridium ragsdalei]OBR94388.1 ADP-ribosylglycohydrolase [Clostridium ragsdalei P11]
MENKILGTLYGMAIGDSMGMPSELWSRRKIKSFFGKINYFLDSPSENETAIGLSKGEFTDDTAQALVILDSLMQNNFIPDKKIIASNLINWAIKTNAFDKNILGPSSKAALNAIQNGEDAEIYTSKALTNGAAMRIAPIGCLFKSDNKEDLVDYVYKISEVTHKTDVAISGASMIAAAVSSAIEDKDWNTIIKDSLDVFEIAKHYGYETFSASLSERLKLALDIAMKYKDDEEKFGQKIYDIIGCGTLTSEAVPSALAIAYFTKNPEKCSLMCANLGGDTDTIGAMATAICGAKVGVKAIGTKWINLINMSNKVDFNYYSQKIFEQRLK